MSSWSRVSLRNPAAACWTHVHLRDGRRAVTAARGRRRGAGAPGDHLAAGPGAPLRWSAARRPGSCRATRKYVMTSKAGPRGVDVDQGPGRTVPERNRGLVGGVAGAAATGAAAVTPGSVATWASVSMVAPSRWRNTDRHDRAGDGSAISSHTPPAVPRRRQPAPARRQQLQRRNSFGQVQRPARSAGAPPGRIGHRSPLEHRRDRRLGPAQQRPQPATSSANANGLGR